MRGGLEACRAFCFTAPKKVCFDRGFIRRSPEQTVSIRYAISKISPIEKNGRSVKISQSLEQRALNTPDCATANILSALESVIACIAAYAWV